MHCKNISSRRQRCAYNIQTCSAERRAGAPLALRLIDALVKARKPHDLMLFPDERHMPRSEADRVYMEERMRDFFVQELGPTALVKG